MSERTPRLENAHSGRKGNDPGARRVPRGAEETRDPVGPVAHKFREDFADAEYVGHRAAEPDHPAELGLPYGANTVPHPIKETRIVPRVAALLSQLHSIFRIPQ